jgi:hypothetical protein
MEAETLEIGPVRLAEEVPGDSTGTGRKALIRRRFTVFNRVFSTALSPFSLRIIVLS